MKQVIIFISLILFISSCSSEDKDNSSSDRDTYSITQKRIKLYSNENDLRLSGDSEYILKGPNSDTYYISLAGYWMQGLYGEVHDLPKEVTDLLKDNESPILTLTISGEAVKSTKTYSFVPEIKSVEFHCKSIKDIRPF